MTLPDPTPEALRRIDELTAAPRGRRVGVLGLGVAGRAMALYLARRGAQVVGADKKAEPPGKAELLAAGVHLAAGAPAAETFAGVEALVISPGVDPEQPAVQAVLRRSVPVLGELELTRGQISAKVAAITGTNGKSTTTGLLGALVEAAGRRAFVGGNFGEPITAWLDKHERADVAVIEVSSFQLEAAYRFESDAAAVLNVTPDHLDRYPSLEVYAAAKQRLLEQMSPEGVAVLSYDDEHTRAMAKACRGRVWWLSTRSPSLPGDGAYVRGNTMVTQGEPKDLGDIDLTHARLLGRHNRENALAALLLARALGLRDAAALARGYRAFAGLEHRLELVGEVGGVRYVNDSKATNDDAAAIAVTAMQGPLVLMLGGRSKGGGYDNLKAAMGDKVRVIVAYGECRDELRAAFAQHPGLRVAERIADAFRVAVEAARPGDAVLLAPACSSYDEFKDYAERGRTFKRWVDELKGEGR